MNMLQIRARQNLRERDPKCNWDRPSSVERCLFFKSEIDSTRIRSFVWLGWECLSGRFLSNNFVGTRDLLNDNILRSHAIVRRKVSIFSTAKSWSPSEWKFWNFDQDQHYEFDEFEFVSTGYSFKLFFRRRRQQSHPTNCGYNNDVDDRQRHW